TSLIYPELPQYIFLAHFYAALANPNIDVEANPELDAEAATEGWVDNSLKDIEGREFLDLLRTYDVNQMESELVSATEAWETWQHYNSSIFELLPVQYWDRVNFIFTAGDKFLCYNLKTLKQMNGKNNSILIRLINQINTLSAFGAEGAVVNNEPEIVSEKVNTINTSKPANIPGTVQPIPIKEKEEYAKEDVKEMDKAAEVSVEKTQEITKAQAERARRLSKEYKKLEIGGEPIEKLLTQPSEMTIEDNTLPFIQPEVPGPDMTGSTIETLDIVYTKTGFKRDLAAIATSFNPLGMFLVETKEETVADDLNRLKKYTFRYEDTRHKSHTIRFTIPDFDETGRCLVNGSLKALNKQRIANPICKVSPTRVTLTANFNKALVERNTNVAHDFLSYIEKYLAKMEGVETLFGDNVYPMKPFANDYTSLGSRYAYFTITPNVSTAATSASVKTKFFFNYAERYSEIPEEFQGKLEEKEKKYGVLSGYSYDTKTAHFIDVEGAFTSVELSSDMEVYHGTLIDKLEEISGVPAAPLSEWVDLKILNKSIPIIFALAYRYGLSAMLKYCNVDFFLEEVGSRSDAVSSDIVVRFQDKRLVIKRTPQVNALLFAGLNNFDLKEVMLEDMDDKNVYYDLIQSRGLSMNNIKGIDDFFDLFIDSMTRDVLRDMHEPTNVRDLLIRATTLLTTREHLDPASSTNYRFRGAEQITGIIYNELARSFATYRNRSLGAKRTWSISEYLIKQKVITQQLMENVTVLNPLDDIKQYTKFSHAGVGGRQSESFKIDDRQYTADAMGTISEATPDNAKVGMTASAPINPVIINARGMSAPVDPKTLTPDNLLSITSILFPCATCDDSKRRISASSSGNRC
ncbi:MAG: hypothetical protein WCR33_03705, partial [Bacilli bacterium]